MSLAMHCDRDDCGTWTRTKTDTAGWLILRFPGWDDEHHFCSMPCLAEWAIQHNRGVDEIPFGEPA
ncbi:hypothetical protein [Nocardia otitidiscaviarum]|uniref:hypothetical protein n=1 Tax=Nocardia otitidiscaviarum TaxID=1823 RepID=UPI0004A6FDA0|nr:hypothetical protein [Nocardia otitidiscaviarum]